VNEASGGQWEGGAQDPPFARGASPPSSEAHSSPGRESWDTIGGGGASVTISSQSGDVALRKL